VTDLKLRKLIFIALMISAAIVLSIIESAISTAFFIIPGVKLGLANIITLVILYVYGAKDAAVVVLLRIFLVSLIYSGLFTPPSLLSFAGGVFAVVTMVLIKKANRFSIIGVSVAGSLMHMVGQILMAMVVLETSALIYYLPYMLLLSVPAGIVTGLASKKLTHEYKKQIERPL
jgi:heptaprenyl diphosphate synthase